MDNIVKNEITITSKRKLFDINIKELWLYKDLLWILVNRDFKTFYKQTILGPIWFFIQPVLSTIVFAFIFNKVAKISTNDIPPYLFYLSGIVLWNYFSNCLISTSNTFIQNAGLFEKVYFPRLIIPTSIIISGLARFIVQFFMFTGFYLYFVFLGEIKTFPSISLLFLFPILILEMGLLGQGLGMIISALTTKYRDLSYLLNFGVQLLMYATPVVYPLSAIPEKYKYILILNPITSIIETLRNLFFNKADINIIMLSYSSIMIFLIFSFGVIIFNKFEKSFVDTI